MRRLLALLLGISLALPAAAGTGDFFSSHPTGWLWYLNPPTPKTQKREIPKDLQMVSGGGLQPMSVAWLKVNLPRLRDIAIDTPNRDNVRAYLIAKRVSLDKASRFAQVAMLVTKGDPGLNEANRFPFAEAGIRVRDSQAQAGKIAAIAELAKHAGLFFFFRSDCPYCHEDLPVLQQLELQTGLKILAVSIDGRGIDDNLFPNWVPDSGQARKLGVTATPSFYLVRPDDQNAVVPIGQGYMSLDELESRIVDDAYYRRWLTPVQYQRAQSVPLIDPGQPFDAAADPTLPREDLSELETAVARLPPPSPTAVEDALTNQHATPLPSDEQ